MVQTKENMRPHVFTVVTVRSKLSPILTPIRYDGETGRSLRFQRTHNQSPTCPFLCRLAPLPSQGLSVTGSDWTGTHTRTRSHSSRIVKGRDLRPSITGTPHVTYTERNKTPVRDTSQGIPVTRRRGTG